MKKRFLNLLAPSALVAGVTIASSGFSPANAASISFSIKDFTGADTEVKFTLDDTIAGAGKVQFKVNYVPTGNNTLADIRGVFFNIANDSLLSGLQISGTDVNAYQFGPAGQVNTVGSSNNNLNGNGNQKKYFDAGVEIGQEGIGKGKGDIQSTVFTLSHSSQALNLAQFSQQNFGVRLMSVGPVNSREGSSKLQGSAPYYAPPPPTPPKQKVPEPGNAAALGLVAVSALGILKKQKQPIS